MRKIFFLLLWNIGFYLPGHSQNIGMGTSTPDPSAILDITSTGKGILIPRMNSITIAAIASPAKGLMVYDSLKNQLLVNMGSPVAPDWQNIAANSGWGLTGNSGTNPLVNFIGTSDSVPLLFRINNNWAGSIDSTYENTAIGYAANRIDKAGSFNTVFGYEAMDSVVPANYNTVFGAESFRKSLRRLGNDANTAAGYQALNTAGYVDGLNTATGYQSLFIGGDENTATGYQAAFQGGEQITATGMQAFRNGTGGECTATGAQALYNNTSPVPGEIGGWFNTASGYAALFNNVSGQLNTAGGYQSLYKNLNGKYNTAYGNAALFSNNSTSQNTAAGSLSLLTTTSSEGNTAVGYNAGHTYNNGYYNCFIGAETDANGPGYYNTIALGHGTLVTAPNMMRVGNGATTSIGGPVGWSTISDGRVKKNVQENVPGLPFINKLRPVSYNIDVTALQNITQSGEVTAATTRSAKQEMPAAMASAYKAKEQILYTGFVAQEVELAAKSLQYSFSGVDAARNDKDLYSLRYAEFVMPLVKAVQELATQQALLKKENTRLRKEQEQVLLSLEAIEQKMH
ncbi:MAG TPA: tail fiber domain-containing protein [Puia sp.]|nr:tail fiber domain-containing protein [Puia sp.]